MSPAWSWAAITCLTILTGFGAWLVHAVIADTIRAYRNDRTDARDVKRGVL